MDGDEPASSAVLKRAFEARLGAMLFKNLAVKHEWKSFLDIAASRLDALEFHDFEQEDAHDTRWKRAAEEAQLRRHGPEDAGG